MRMLEWIGRKCPALYYAWTVRFTAEEVAALEKMLYSNLLLVEGDYVFHRFCDIRLKMNLLRERG